MNGSLRRIAVFTCLALGWASGLAMAEPAGQGFGFGGAMAMALFPDMTGVNTFLSENGLDAMGDMLFGGGGNGRGGIIGGPAFGGIGWGLVATSEKDGREAALVLGGGGFDLGLAIGGDEGSVLTVGAVLGGGANVLTLSGFETPIDDVEPTGIVPAPLSRELVRVVGFVQPYVSLSAQLLPWMGFELRIGYLFEALGMEVGDDLGIPAPSLNLSGPTVSFGIVFGGIGSATSAEPQLIQESGDVVEVSQGTLAVTLGGELVIENIAGDITITSYPVQTASNLTANWQATRTADPDEIALLQPVAVYSDLTTFLSSTGEGRIDYVVSVPAGLDLRVKNGAGVVTLLGHQASTIILENGAGELLVQDVDALALFVNGGVGRIELQRANAQKLVAEVGVGEVWLGLPPNVSATVLAKAGIGDVNIDRFPVMTGGVRGFLGKTGDVILGGGERIVQLKAGIGRVDVRVQLP